MGEDPIAKMLKKMMADLTEIKSDVKSNNTKIDSLTIKVEDLTNKNKNIEEKTENSLKEIRQEIVQVEESVTNKLMAEIKPSLEGMKNEVQNAACQDLRRLVQEEVELMRRREAKEKAVEEKASEEAGETGEDPEKNTKSKKNIKLKNTKNIEDETAASVDAANEEPEEVVPADAAPEAEK